MKIYCKLKPSTKEVLQMRLIGDDVAGPDMSAQGEEYCHNTFGGEWKQCSQDESTCDWEAPNPPGPMPFEAPYVFTWDEETQSWIPES